MPYAIRKISRLNKYRVVNKATGRVHAFRTTLKKAQKQVRLLQMIDHGGLKRMRSKKK